MAQAHCQNENCEKTEWTLRKPVSEYRGGSPQCPDCGTTSVRVQTEGNEQPQNQPVKTGKDRQTNQETQEVQAVQAVEQSQEMQTQEASAGSLVDAAEQTGKTLAEMQNASPEEKADLEGTLLTGAGRVLIGYAGQRAKSKKEGAQRARETEKDTINPVEDFPQCGSCGVQLRNLPPVGERFDCPRCGTRLEA